GPRQRPPPGPHRPARGSSRRSLPRADGWARGRALGGHPRAGAARERGAAHPLRQAPGRARQRPHVPARPPPLLPHRRGGRRAPAHRHRPPGLLRPRLPPRPQDCPHHRRPRGRGGDRDGARVGSDPVPLAGPRGSWTI
ncbi:MAG: MG(2+) CHELATASE FAMILY PROTEIN / ComM-related protein, partial [uncultured Gemmatimonadetes bacterium]